MKPAVICQPLSKFDIFTFYIFSQTIFLQLLQNLNLMQSMSTQLDIRYKFLKAIECLEQNIRKQIDCQRPLNLKQMNWVQNIQIEMRKFEAIKCLEIQAGKVSTCSFYFYLVNFKIYQRSSIQLVGKMTLDTFDFNKHLAIS